MQRRSCACAQHFPCLVVEGIPRAPPEDVDHGRYLFVPPQREGAHALRSQRHRRLDGPEAESFTTSTRADVEGDLHPGWMLIQTQRGGGRVSTSVERSV